MSNASALSCGIRLCSVFKRSMATPMFTMGFEKFMSSFGSSDGWNKPAAMAESDRERTHVRRTGITPPTRVLSSRIYFASSAESSASISGIVALARRLRLVRMLRAERILLLLEAGTDKTDMRSLWFVSRRFSWEVTAGRESGSNWSFCSAASSASSTVCGTFCSAAATRSETVDPSGRVLRVSAEAIVESR